MVVRITISSGCSSIPLRERRVVNSGRVIADGFATDDAAWRWADDHGMNDLEVTRDRVRNAMRER